MRYILYGILYLMINVGKFVFVFSLMLGGD